MVFPIIFAALAATSRIPGASAKPTINPPLPHNISGLSLALMDNLCPEPSSVDPWPVGWIPAGCERMTRYNKVDITAKEVEAFNVTFDDCCDDAWVLCRHKDANLTRDDLIDLFARIPVRMRSYVRHILAVPAVNVTGYSWGNDIILSGPAVLSTLVHEIGHNLDARAYNVSGRFSRTPLWLSQVENDTAVVNIYGNQDAYENHAEETVVAVYDNNVPGGIREVIPHSWQQIEHQFTTIQSLLGDTLVPGGVCFRRFPNTDPITVASGSIRIAGGLGPTKPANPPLSDHIQPLESGDDEEVIVTHYDENGNPISSEITPP